MKICCAICIYIYIYTVFFYASFQSLLSFFFNRTIVLFFSPVFFVLNFSFVHNKHVFPGICIQHISIHAMRKGQKKRLKKEAEEMKRDRNRESKWARKGKWNWMRRMKEKRTSISEMSKHQLKYFYLKKRENAELKSYDSFVFFSHILSLSHSLTNLLLPLLSMLACMCMCQMVLV